MLPDITSVAPHINLLPDMTASCNLLLDIMATMLQHADYHVCGASYQLAS